MIHLGNISKLAVCFYLNLMTENNFPIWRQELKSARKKEGKSPSNRWIQLSTVTSNNEPRIRTVVFRGWEKESSMLIFTDRRSDKIEHLKYNPKAEILWLFLRSKSQFRFKGNVKELKENNQHWDSLSDRSKSTWFWQPPGKEINNNLLTAQIIPTSLNKPETFVALEFKIYSVDFLKLETPIHKRYIWEKENNWKRIEINP